MLQVRYPSGTSTNLMPRLSFLTPRKTAWVRRHIISLPSTSTYTLRDWVQRVHRWDGHTMERRTSGKKKGPRCRERRVKKMVEVHE